MLTGCFFTYTGTKGVSVSRFNLNIKKWPSYIDLAPSLSLLNDIKSNKINWDEYTFRYYKETLSQLNPYKIYDDLKDNVILCYEKPNQHCHRFLVRDWIYDELGIKILEWNPNMENFKQLF